MMVVRAHPCSRRKPYYGRRPPTGLLPDSRDNKANEYISFSLFRGDFMHSAWKMDRKLRVWCEGGVQTDSLETQQSNLPTLPPSTFLFGGIYRFKEGELKFMLTNTQTLMLDMPSFCVRDSWELGFRRSKGLLLSDARQL